MRAWLLAYKKTITQVVIVTSIVIVAICLVLGFITGIIPDFINSFFRIIAPITLGFAISYLSNPIVTFFERKVFKRIRRFKIRRLTSVLITFALIITLIALAITILIPSLLETFKTFWETYIAHYEDTITNLAFNINATLDRFEAFQKIERLDPALLIRWVKEALPWIDEMVAGDFSHILSNLSQLGNINISSLLEFALSLSSSLFNVVKNIVLGLFIAGYMLMAKDRFKAYLRRLLNSFLSPKKVRTVIRFGKLLDRTFGGFIEGQLIDAGVVGIICYIVFIIFRMPIPHLLATIIAVTNVIPIFGPFIGGIPAAFLVLLTAPNKTILFIVLLVIIQQIDGNIICPHILGDKIKISSLATIIAIITMGGLFGIFGMVIGVPFFAVIIHLLNDYTMNSLRKKGLETSLNHYFVGNPEQITDKKSNKQVSLKSIFRKNKSINKDKEN